MSKRLIIIGAGGHGKVVADIALRCGYFDISFVDDHVSSECMGFPIIGKCDELIGYNDGKTDFIIAVGDNGSNVTIGEGTVVMANAVINACASIGTHCIVNSGAIVEHDNVLSDYVHISPNASLGGMVQVGSQTHICIGAVVINNINICSNVKVGAGSVIIDSIEEGGTYVGVPGRKKK